MTGLELMTAEQRREWSDLEERFSHAGTMRFSALDAVHLSEYRALALRLEAERDVDDKTGPGSNLFRY